MKRQTIVQYGSYHLSRGGSIAVVFWRVKHIGTNILVLKESSIRSLRLKVFINDLLLSAMW